MSLDISNQVNLFEVDLQGLVMSVKNINASKADKNDCAVANLTL